MRGDGPLRATLPRSRRRTSAGGGHGGEHDDADNRHCVDDIADGADIHDRWADGTDGTGAATQAAARTLAQNSIHVEVPGVGRIELPPPDQLVFLGGIAALVVLQIIEWPVAAVLAVGHVLAHNRHHALLRDFGEALDEA